MISKLIALLRNRPSSREEARLEDVLRNEATRVRNQTEDDEAAITNIVERARRRPQVRQNLPSSPWVSIAPGLFGAAALIVLVLVILQPANLPSPEETTPPQSAGPSPNDASPQEAPQTNPSAEELFAQPVKTLTDPFAALAFNPLEPVTEEWNRFTEETKENAESFVATAKYWTTLPDPTPSIKTDRLIRELPDLRRFNPYGNELQHLRNDIRNLIEALPFIPNQKG